MGITHPGWVGLPAGDIRPEPNHLADLPLLEPPCAGTHLRYRHEVIDMNHGDPDLSACFPVSKPPTAVFQPWTSQHSLWQCRPTNPLRVTIVTAFCTCDMDAPKPSYMPRLPT